MPPDWSPEVVIPAVLLTVTVPPSPPPAPNPPTEKATPTPVEGNAEAT